MICAQKAPRASHFFICTMKTFPCSPRNCAQAVPAPKNSFILARHPHLYNSSLKEFKGAQMLFDSRREILPDPLEIVPRVPPTHPRGECGAARSSGCRLLRATWHTSSSTLHSNPISKWMLLIIPHTARLSEASTGALCDFVPVYV